MPKKRTANPKPKVHVCTSIWLEILAGLETLGDKALLEKAKEATDVPDLSKKAEARRKKIIEMADGQSYVSEGEVEIDPDARLAESGEDGDNGCYVAAWVWCPLDGTKYDKEK